MSYENQTTYVDTESSKMLANAITGIGQVTAKYISDDVKKRAKSFLTNNNQFRKHVFVDGTSITAPKGHLMSGAEENGAKKQGLNTVFKPKIESKENGGFILNTNHNPF